MILALVVAGKNIKNVVEKSRNIIRYILHFII